MSHAYGILDVLREIMLGGRHSRRTVASHGVSLPTADRWLKQLRQSVPGMYLMRIGNVSWVEWRPPNLEAWIRAAQVNESRAPVAKKRRMVRSPA